MYVGLQSVFEIPMYRTMSLVSGRVQKLSGSVAYLIGTQNFLLLSGDGVVAMLVSSNLTTTTGEGYA